MRAAAGSSTPQSEATPTNDAPNPFQTIEGYFKLPEGRTWGSTSAVDIARDGRSIWVAERCGANTCVADPPTGKMSPLDPMLLFDESGKLVRSFGAGLMAFPHGIHVDRDGNVWVTDGNGNAPQAAVAPAPDAARVRSRRQAAARQRAAARRAAALQVAALLLVELRQAAGRAAAAAPRRRRPLPVRPVGHQVFKFSPDGKVLLTIGEAGGATGPTSAAGSRTT